MRRSRSGIRKKKEKTIIRVMRILSGRKGRETGERNDNAEKQKQEMDDRNEEEKKRINRGKE